MAYVLAPLLLAGPIPPAAAMSTGAPFWTVVPGLVVCGGTTFPSMFVCVAAGVRPSEAGIASAPASTSQQFGGAVDLAILIAVATAGGAEAHGLRTAMVDRRSGLHRRRPARLHPQEATGRTCT